MILREPLKIRYDKNMLSELINNLLKKARYKILRDGTYFGEIPGARGVWANKKNLEECREELREVLEEWILLKVSGGDKIPGLNLKLPHRARRIQYA
jgi:predicted RNase H-like HicB family nuclease